MDDNVKKNFKKNEQMLLFVRKVCSVSRALETCVWSSFFLYMLWNSGL